MKKKFMELVKRQTVLAAKAASGTASKVEVAELAKITTAIKAATDDDNDTQATTLTTMTLTEFRTWHDKAVKAIEDGDAELLPLVKKNLASIKTQAKTDGEDIVAVEMPVEKSETDRIAELEARIKALESEDEDGDTGGEGDDPEGAAAASKEAKPTAQALALEAIDTLLAKYEEVKTAIEAGGVTKEQLDAMWDDWLLKDAIRTSAAIMAKCEELKTCVTDVMPVLEKLDDGEDGGDGDGDGGDGDGGDGEEDDAGGEGDGGDGGENDVNKSGPSSAWLGGRDLAAKNQTPEEQVAAIKAAKEKGR